MVVQTKWALWLMRVKMVRSNAHLHGGVDKVGVVADAGVDAEAVLDGAPVGVGRQLRALAEHAHEPAHPIGVGPDDRAARVSQAAVLARLPAGADDAGKVDVGAGEGVGILRLAGGLAAHGHVHAHEGVGVDQVGVGQGAEARQRDGRARGEPRGAIDAVHRGPTGAVQMGDLFQLHHRKVIVVLVHRRRVAGVRHKRLYVVRAARRRAEVAAPNHNLGVAQWKRASVAAVVVVEKAVCGGDNPTLVDQLSRARYTPPADLLDIHPQWKIAW